MVFFCSLLFTFSCTYKDSTIYVPYNPNAFSIDKLAGSWTQLDGTNTWIIGSDGSFTNFINSATNIGGVFATVNGLLQMQQNAAYSNSAWVAFPERIITYEYLLSDDTKKLVLHPFIKTSGTNDTSVINGEYTQYYDQDFYTNTNNLTEFYSIDTVTLLISNSNIITGTFRSTGNYTNNTGSYIKITNTILDCGTYSYSVSDWSNSCFVITNSIITHTNWMGITTNFAVTDATSHLQNYKFDSSSDKGVSLFLDGLIFGTTNSYNYSNSVLIKQ